jgi:hypothetical protein
VDPEDAAAGELEQTPDGAWYAPSWEPQEEGMMRTTASFPQL